MVIINKKQKDVSNNPENIQKEQEIMGFGSQDEYQTKGFELVQWVQDNKGIVIITILSLLIIAIGMSSYSYYMKRINEEASAAYLEVIKQDLSEEDEEKILSKEEIEKRITSLKSIMDKYKNSSVVSLVTLKIGYLSLQENKYAEALSFYEEAIKKIDDKDNLYPVAILGLAKSLELNNRKQEATNYLEKIIAEDKLFPGRDKALWEAAKLLKESDKEKSKKYIADLISDYPESSFFKKAKSFQMMIE